jgi:hypothetical protein
MQTPRHDNIPRIPHPNPQIRPHHHRLQHIPQIRPPSPSKRQCPPPQLRREKHLHDPADDLTSQQHDAEEEFLFGCRGGVDWLEGGGDEFGQDKGKEDECEEQDCAVPGGGGEGCTEVGADLRWWEPPVIFVV